MDKKEVINILQNRDRNLEETIVRIRGLEKMLSEPGYLYAMNAYPVQSFNEEQVMKSRNIDTMETMIRKIQDEKQMLKEEIERQYVVEEHRRDMINRVWFSFKALDSPYYEIINETVVKKAALKEVEKKLGISHAEMSRKKNTAFKRIIESAESRTKTSELAYNASLRIGRER